LNQRVRRELRRPNRSLRVDETYIKVAGNWTYLYRAVDSAGETIEFMLSPKRDRLRRSCSCAWHYPPEAPPSPRVCNTTSTGTHAMVVRRGAAVTKDLARSEVPVDYRRAREITSPHTSTRPTTGWSGRWPRS